MIGQATLFDLEAIDVDPTLEAVATALDAANGNGARPERLGDAEAAYRVGYSNTNHDERKACQCRPPLLNPDSDPYLRCLSCGGHFTPERIRALKTLGRWPGVRR